MREFRAAGLGGRDAAIAHWVLDGLAEVLGHWQHYQAGELNRLALLAAVQPAQEGLRLPLTWGSAQTRALCWYRLVEWESLWSG